MTTFDVANPESPIRAKIVSRFDLGFILQHPNGRRGELRVPEMSAATSEWDRSPDVNAGVGAELAVYIVRETNGGYLFSEFSAIERDERERQKELAISAQEQAEVGQQLSVVIAHKQSWGCICREVDGLVEGVILSQPTIEEKGWVDPELQISKQTWESLFVGSRVDAVIARKEWAHWRYINYLALKRAMDAD